jgi:uncharacterized membrane protein YbhN (UPF0104 family)
VTASNHVTRFRRWLPWLGALLGVVALAWVLRGLDLARFSAVVANADVRFVLMVPVIVAVEQMVRAWKWRQLLWPLRSIGTVYLFGAIMAGYLLAVIVPFGFGTVARSWLVAQREHLKLMAVLATVAVDRLTDGIVFACLVPLAVLAAVFPDPTGGIRAGLIWGGAGSFILFVLLLIGLEFYRRQTSDHPDVLLKRLGDRLPAQWAGFVGRLAGSFGDGISWLQSPWRAAGVVAASVVIKLIAATQFLGSGLAFGISLRPVEYLFLMVFLGFLVILGHFLRLTGGFIIAAVFALGLFGVPDEQALAMALVVQASNLLSVALIGAVALSGQGIAISELSSLKDAKPSIS